MKAAISPRSRFWVSPCWSSPSRWCSPSTRSRYSAPVPARACGMADVIASEAKQSTRPQRKTGLRRRGVYHRARRSRDPLAPHNDEHQLLLNTVNPIGLDLGLEAVERRRGCCAVDGIFSFCQQRKHLHVDRGRMMNDVAVIVQIVGYLPGHAKIVKRDVRKLRQSRQRVGGEVID